MSTGRTISLRKWRDNLSRNAGRIAEHRLAAAIVFTMELVGCAIFTLPNALVMVGMVMAAPRKWLRFALAATAGDMAGGVALYAVSRLFFESYGARLIGFYQAA